MASSEENPASAAPPSADDSDGSDSGGDAEVSKKPKKKTLIGLGKLRESLKSASSGKKGSSLPIPKPRKHRRTAQGMPLAPSSSAKPADPDLAEPELADPDPAEPAPAASSLEASSEPEDDDGPATDRVGEVPEDLFDEFDGDEAAEPEGPQTIEVESDTDRIDGSLVEDIELAASVELDEPMEAEATMLTESPFEAEATMVSESPLGDETSVGEEFDGGGKTTVSLTGSMPDPTDPEPTEPKPTEPKQAAPGASPTPLTHTTNPNPPTPEQKPRSGNYSVPPTSSPNVQIEATLIEDSDAADDDFHAEKTEVFDSPYEDEALVARLVVLGGPASGQEFLLNKQRNTIGRGKKNTIVVSDLAMSRQHLEILEQNDKTYLLVDLQAANGTRLNSTRIEEAELMHGDRIEAGKSELQFIIPGTRPQQRTKNRHLIAKRDVGPPQNRTMVRQMQGGQGIDDETTDKVLTYVIIGAGLLSLLLIGAAVYLFVNDASAPTATAQAVATEDPKAQALYLEGVERVKDRQWDKARALFEEVGETDAEFAGISAQLERVSREKRAQQKLEQAESLFEQDQSDEAGKLAMMISNQSVYFEDAQALLRKARQRRIAQLYEKAQDEVTAENFEEAKTLLAAILEEVPNHKGALELEETLASTDEEEAEEAEEDARDRKRSRRSRRRTSRSNSDWLSSSGSRSARSASGSATRVNFTKGFTLYKAGKFDKAAKYFKGAASRSSGALSSRAAKTAKNIERFDKSYKRAARAFDAGAWKTAIDGFASARRADRSVAKSGYFKSEINAKLATAHGKIGLSDFAKSNFAGANKNYAAGYKYERSNSTINTLRRKLSNKARGLYIQAANKRKTDPDQASKLCRRIMAMVPSSHLMHQKAKKMLGEL